MTASRNQTRCKVCGEEKLQGERRHAHCAGCGKRLDKPEDPHTLACPRAGIHPHASCPKCRRLLAAGAHCPAHGDPRQYDLVPEAEGAPK